MRNYTLLLISMIIGISNVKSQDRPVYTAQPSLIKKHSTLALNKLITNYSVYKIPTEAIAKEVEKGSSNFTLKLSNKLNFDFNLFPNKIVASNYLLSSKTEKEHKKLATTT